MPLCDPTGVHDFSKNRQEWFCQTRKYSLKYLTLLVTEGWEKMKSMSESSIYRRRTIQFYSSIKNAKNHSQLVRRKPKLVVSLPPLADIYRVLLINSTYVNQSSHSLHRYCKVDHNLVFVAS